mgnify:CR=1 FL=1
MEKWIEVNKGMIPAGEYLMHLQYGDFENLIVFLKSDKFEVTLEFDGDMSFHCVDESRWPFLPYDMELFSYYQKKKFDNVLYRIYGGKYYNFSRKHVGQLFFEEEFIHYIVVASNYFIEVITVSTINVTVRNLETEDIRKYVI